MKHTTLTAVMTCALVVRSWACVNPTNIEGVAFTAEESLNIEIITAAGTENVNFFIDGQPEPVGIRYMSHYDPRAMIFVGGYGLSYLQDLKLNCMGVILPLPDTADPYAQIEKQEFDFTAAITTELRWLTENGVVSLSEETITRIESALAQSYNGGNQYWTHANSVLGYNSWYRYDTTENKWYDDQNGVDGVRGVSGVNGVLGCSVISPDVEVPPKGLDPTPVSRTYARSPGLNNSMVHLRISHCTTGGLTIALPYKTIAAKKLTIFNCQGSVVYRKPVHIGSIVLTVYGLPQGIYIGKVR